RSKAIMLRLCKQATRSRGLLLLCAACVSIVAVTALSEVPPVETTVAKTIRTALLSKTVLNVERAPLGDVLKELSRQHGVTIRLDEEALKKAGIAADLPVTFSAKKYTLKVVLRSILKHSGLIYMVENGSLVVTVVPEREVLKIKIRKALNAPTK